MKKHTKRDWFLAIALSLLTTPVWAQSGTKPVQVSVDGNDGVNQLIIFSCLGVAEIGENAMVAGFIISGAPGTKKQVLIRGVASSLRSYGIAAPLRQPQLVLYDAKGNRMKIAYPFDTYFSARDDIGILISSTG